MNRLRHTILWDIRLQFRNGFYYAALIMGLFLVLIGWQIDQTLLLWLLPALIVNNLIIGTFFFSWRHYYCWKKGKIPSPDW